MPNPFGITEVNLPQIFAGAQQVQEGRIRNLILNQQLQQAERQAEREQGIRQIIAGALARPQPQGQQGSAQGGSGQGSPRSLAEVAQAFGQPDTSWQPQPQQSAQPQPAQPAQPRVNMRDLFGQLVGAGMETREARETAQAIAGADPQQFEMAVAQSAALADVLEDIQRVPADQRQAYIASVAPRLESIGIGGDRLGTLDLSDAGLGREIGTARAIANSRSRDQSRYRTVDGVVIDERRLARGERPDVYTSPFINVGGSLYARPAAPSAPQNLPRVSTPQEASQLPPGSQFIDPNGNVRTVPGGPSQQQPAAGSF